MPLAHLLWKSGLLQEPDSSPGEFLRLAEAADLGAINLQVLLEHDFLKSSGEGGSHCAAAQFQQTAQARCTAATGSQL